jgi:hypothetical protein
MTDKRKNEIEEDLEDEESAVLALMNEGAP